MTIAELMTMPTTLEVGGHRFHESLFRCYHVLAKLIALLEAGVDSTAAAAIARELNELPHICIEKGTR